MNYLGELSSIVFIRFYLFYGWTANYYVTLSLKIGGLTQFF
jgi:hypothetical protein